MSVISTFDLGATLLRMATAPVVSAELDLNNPGPRHRQRVWRDRNTAPNPVVTAAAQYVRMSTEGQEYSIANQMHAIAQYAIGHGLAVVRTYADAGKSGLDACGRDGLTTLLDDIVAGRADFRTLLVFDVSRWGRFQDCDESACYEFLCRRSGIRVEYCSEAFRNDGSPVSAVMKSLKRVMAAEYSRELSAKVFAGQARGCREGFVQGGSPGYALRRILVDGRGGRRMPLERHDHKCLQSDRVLLGPGPASEVRTLRWMFEQVDRYRRTTIELERMLNDWGVPATPFKTWRAQRITQMLTNERYIGTLTYNRCSMKLKSARVWNPRDQWVRVERAFPAVIEPGLFRRVQAVLGKRATRISNEAAIASLRALLEKHGTLSEKLIDGTPGMPGSAFYAHRFGGLYGAYRIVGFETHRQTEFVRGFGRRKREAVRLRATVGERLKARGAAVEWNRTVATIDGRHQVVVLIAKHRRAGDRDRWDVQMHLNPHPDWGLVACESPDGDGMRDYWLVSRPGPNVSLGIRHRRARLWIRSGSLEALLDRLLAEVRP